MTMTLLIAILASLNLALAVSISWPKPPTPPKSEIDLFANETAPDCRTVDDYQSVQNGVIGPALKWTNFFVYPDPEYDDNERQAINNAMHKLMQVLPCVGFGIWEREDKPWGDYVYIIKGTDNGCRARVGKQPGLQFMDLQSPGCMSTGTIMHEMIHSLGLHHEHRRNNRDDYVTIHYENVQGGEGNRDFQKLPVAGGWWAYGVPYNQRSIMHYPNTAYSKNGEPTITAKNGEPVGTEGILQPSDIEKLNKMYDC